MQRLVAVESPEDVFPEYRNTPIGRLFAYHNLGAPLDSYQRAELLVGMCMDHRVRLRIPDRFAYVLRRAAANLRHSDFEVSYAVAVGRVTGIALIGHTDCGMVEVGERRREFVDSLVKYARWDEERAAEHFRDQAPRFGIGDAVEFTVCQASRLRALYPGVLVAPLQYRLDDDRLYLIRE